MILWLAAALSIVCYSVRVSVLVYVDIIYGENIYNRSQNMHVGHANIYVTGGPISTTIIDIIIFKRTKSRNK